MKQTKISRVALRQKWAELVAEYQRRGISATAFCQEHKIHKDTFRYWCKKIDGTLRRGRSDQVTASRFISLAPRTPPPPRLAAPRIVLPNGVAIELNASLDTPVVSAFLKSLCGVSPSSENGGFCAKS